MKRGMWAIVLCLLTVAVARAQAPGGDDSPGGRRGRGGPGGGDQGGPGGGGGGPGGRMGGFPNLIFQALDVDGDQEISEQELRKAAANLKKLDKDGDGRITQDELRPTGTQMAEGMFTRMDRNGDGRITPDEAPQGGPFSQMLTTADKDGDGAVTKEELGAAMDEFGNRFRGGPGGGPGGGGPGGPGGDGPGAGGPGGGFGRDATNPRQMAKQLMANDANGDGKLSPNEVPQQFMGLLRGGDTNGDKMIDARELQALLRRNPGGAGAAQSGQDTAGGSNNGGARGRRSYDRFNTKNSDSPK